MSIATVQNGTSMGMVVSQQAGALAAETIEQVLLSGDINKLNPKQKVDYYLRVCDSLGLNPATQPFEFIVLNGKMRFYATKACTEQLRKINGVSVTIASREEVAGCYIVTAKAVDKWGRSDESIGAVPIENIKGEARSNAMMKAETKAKRRVTLSICGLGLLDESEVESIPGAGHVRIPQEAIAQARAAGPVASELELTLQASLAQVQKERAADAPKDETPASALASAPGQPGTDSGSVQAATADTGEAPSESEVGEVRAAIKKLGWAAPKARAWALKNFGVGSANALSKDQCASALALLMAAQLDDNDDAYSKVYDRLKAEGRVL